MEEFFPSLHWSQLLIIPGLLLGFTVHELGHALMAYFLGDYSQVERGKITLNPLEHISWLGTIAFVLIGFGWPKPVIANPRNFKRRYLDLAVVAMCGPLASLILGLLGMLLTLVMAAALVTASGVSTEGVFRYLFPSVFPFLFPIMADLPETLNLRTWSIALTGYIAATSFWITLISLLPLPGMDGLTALISVIAHVRERRDKTLRQTRPARQPAPLVADRPITLLNQQQRRNSAATIHFNAGADFHEENRYEDAIARYRQAISNDQNFGPAYINMGLAYLAKGERRRAIQAFRGAVQYSDDQQSHAQAWYQLHQLSEISPIDQKAAEASMVELGASPWTDTKPRPNWLALGISGVLYLAGGVFIYGYLVTSLMTLLKAV